MAYNNNEIKIHNIAGSGYEEEPRLYMKISCSDITRSGDTLSMTVYGGADNTALRATAWDPDGYDHTSRYFGYSIAVGIQLDDGDRVDGIITKPSSPDTWGEGVYYLSSNKVISSTNLTTSSKLKIYLNSDCTCSENGSYKQVFEVSLSAPPASYDVTYNANGGTGAPAPQIKHYGIPLQLSSQIPTRDGYNFNNWNTSAGGGGGTSYSPSATYTTNAPLSLYAQWQIKTYTVTFDLAGGTRTGGGALSQTISHGGDATPPTCTRTGYEFTGWSGSYTNVTSGRTITAKWTILPIWIYNGSWKRIRKVYKYQSGSWVQITPKIFNGTSWVNMT